MFKYDNMIEYVLLFYRKGGGDSFKIKYYIIFI